MIRSTGATKGLNTVVMTACVNGDMLPPLVVLKGASVPDKILKLANERDIKYIEFKQVGKIQRKLKVTSKSAAAN